MVNRAVLAHRLFTGITRQHLARLVEELAVSWQADLEGRRHAARGGVRKRAEGAGARHQLVFVDRLVATLIHLRYDLAGEAGERVAVRGCYGAVPRQLSPRVVEAYFAFIEQRCAHEIMMRFRRAVESQIALFNRPHHRGEAVTGRHGGRTGGSAA